VDEHTLRDRLLAEPSRSPVSHVVVTVPDWIADPSGLFVADFDLLNRLPGLARIDIVATEGVLASGFHERLHTWWPGLDELTGAEIVGARPPVRPMLVHPDPADAPSQTLWFTYRDREEELIAIAARVADRDLGALNRTAVVFKRPLPYLYLAGETLGANRIPFRMADGLPLAAEPTAAVVDLVFDAIESGYAREPLLAVLRSPHVQFHARLSSAALSALDQALSATRYLGQADRLFELAREWSNPGEARPGDRAAIRHRAVPALQQACVLVRELLTIAAAPTASRQIRAVVGFLESHLAPLSHGAAFTARESRGRTIVLNVLRGMADAHAAHHDPRWTITEAATAVRRWIGDQTFRTDQPAGGVRLLDDQAARYGDFEDVTIVGLIETDWPDRGRRNVFYSPSLLRSLNWPSERDRRAAADARFLDLLTSSSGHVELSAFLLDDESIVSRSIQLDEVARARLSTVTRTVRPKARRAEAECEGGAWRDLRRSRTAASDPSFHGQSTPPQSTEWSVSAIETYLTCPFKFFAQHVLRLQEEPGDEEVMDPRRQGDFVHAVFETFFMEWQAAGHQAITPANLPVAREFFTTVVDEALTRLPEGEAALERTRLLGSPAMVGLGEAVFRMEAERSEPVVGRLIEHRLSGPIVVQTEAGARAIALRGKADRIDLLADGTFRLIDYKLGWAPDRNLALQLPIYAVAAEQRLHQHGRRWRLGEAMYIAFKEPRRVVPLFSRERARGEVLSAAQQRLADAIDGIQRGEFPPTPHDVFRCDSCAYRSVCRRDYVGDI
jgi:RecB family exonuclease